MKSPGGISTDNRWEEWRMFRFNWARSNELLAEDLVEWLKDNRPSDRQQFDKGHRTSYRDMLKTLGALRVLHYFEGDTQSAGDYTANSLKDKDGEPKSLYADPSDWRKAERRAKELLGRFSREVLG